jgi:mRNA interferase RelE/StbE
VPVRFEIRFKKSAQKEIQHIHQPDFRRLMERIQALAECPVPSDAVKLVGSEYWRLRQGDWRIVYAKDDDSGLVTIMKVAHRREVYRATK